MAKKSNMKSEILSDYEKTRRDVYAPLVDRLDPKWKDQKIFIFAISMGLGWRKIIFDLVAELDNIWDGFKRKKGHRNWTLRQAKEKFGGLCFYVSHPHDPGRAIRTFDALDKAQKDAWKTCERCGGAGHAATDGGRVATLCDACEKRWEGRRKQGVWDAVFG